MTTSLEQFKAHYPNAALISDLVSTHEGQYVVRTAVVQKGETLATGLAANAVVQVAEDQARDRAIALLGITLISSPTPVAPAKATASTPASTPAAPQPAPPKPTAEPSITPPPKPAEQTSQTQTTLLAPEPDTAFQITPDEVPPPSAEEDFGPPIDAIVESANNDAPSTPAKPSAAAIALENLSTSSSPVDLSDVIAQTDVELTRLGWSSTQGREYLEKTYGKRSRQQLTDDELMSFLLYLEDQS
ncbi:MAG: hypothetical protein AAFP03_18155 [Cyanobacteria bacterium J06598_3]